MQELADWCRTELGAAPVRELFVVRRVSEVVGLQLTDGRAIVVKTRRDENGRVAGCLAVQAEVARRTSLSARPLTGVSFVHGRARHAEEFVPDGSVRAGDDAATAAVFGSLYARTVAVTSGMAVLPPLPNPPWVRWSEPTAFPPLWWQEPSVPAGPLPTVLTDTVDRVRNRLAGCSLPAVLGHADWETQNIRWNGDQPLVVHDWDSLALLPEAALVGIAAGMFANDEARGLAPVASSGAFLDAYQLARGRRFGREDGEIAWAATLWPALYNARIQILYGLSPVALAALEAQAPERLALASA